MCIIFQQVLEAFMSGQLTETFKDISDDDERLELIEKMKVENNSDIVNRKEAGLRFLRDAGTGTGALTSAAKIYIFADINDPDQVLIEGWTFPKDYVLGPSTNSDSEFRTAERWLRDCVANHGCGKERPGQFPARLLDLQDTDIHLIETDGSERPYSALSHCWGDPKHRRLISTVTTIHKHQAGIPWAIIPKTFQDAITICRRLKVRYLWIDTLCILQQDQSLTDDQVAATEQDFAKENSAMADIYRGS